MSLGADREGVRREPGVLLVEEHPDHAVVLAELLEDHGWQVEQVSTRAASSRSLPPVVLLSTATDPAGAAALVGTAERSSPPSLVILLDGPGRRWDPDLLADSRVVAGVIDKGTGPGFLARLADLAAARRAAKGRAAGEEPPVGAPLPADCGRFLVQWRAAALETLLAHLGPFVRLAGPAAEPLAGLLERAGRLARDLRDLVGPVASPRPRQFRPADLVRLRREAWDRAGAPRGELAAAPEGLAVHADPDAVGRLLDGLVALLPADAPLRLAVGGGPAAGGVDLLLEGPFPGPGDEGLGACSGLAAELGLHLERDARGSGVRLRFPPARPGIARSRHPGHPPRVLLAAGGDETGERLARFYRERGARVTQVESREEVRGLLAAGCSFELVLLGPGMGAWREVRRALPRAGLVGVGDGTAEDARALLAAGGFGWIGEPPDRGDLVAAWRLAIPGAGGAAG